MTPAMIWCCWRNRWLQRINKYKALKSAIALFITFLQFHCWLL